MTRENWLVPALLLAAAAACFVIAAATDIRAQAIPYPKNGQCTGSYIQSGGYCVPQSSRSAPSIAKGREPCPAGWQQSGNGCVQMERRR
jgi:hypothetical protein